jgi:hypothetical protein
MNDIVADFPLINKSFNLSYSGTCEDHTMIWKLAWKIGKVGIRTEPPPDIGDVAGLEPSRIQQELLDIMGQALTIRQVDAGSCNGCELEINAWATPTTTSRAWASALSPARATPTCCWSPARCRATWRWHCAHV